MMNFNEWLLLRYYYEVGKQPDGTTDASAYTPTLVQLVRDKVAVIRANEKLKQDYKKLKASHD